MYDDSTLFIYDPATEIVLPYNHKMLIGWVDTKKYMTTEERIQAMRDSAPPLRDVIHSIDEGYTIELPKDDQKDSDVPVEETPMYRMVWVCYVNDSYDHPVVVKVVGSTSEADEWIEETPAVMGDVEGRKRFCERYVIRDGSQKTLGG